MIDVESYMQHAHDCVRQAESEEVPEHRDILLNVALAWLRLAQQGPAMNATQPSAIRSE